MNKNYETNNIQKVKKSDKNTLTGFLGKCILLDFDVLSVLECYSSY